MKAIRIYEKGGPAVLIYEIAVDVDGDNKMGDLCNLQCEPAIAINYVHV